jgi:DUF4097 and DUF4098 domain-containing protein YvlB
MLKQKHFIYGICSFSILLLLLSCDDGVFYAENQVTNTNFAYSDSFSYEIPIVDQVRIDMQTINGSITLRSFENQTVLRISGERIVESESIEDARENLPRLQVDILEGAEEIYVTTKQPEQNQGRNYKVIYNVDCPQDWDVSLNQVNGNIEVTDFRGDAAIGLVNGNLILNQIYGSVAANLVNGIINALLRIPTPGYCHLHNVNGQILLSIPDTTSAQFCATVVNGSIGVNQIILQDLQSTKKEVRGKLGDGEGTIDLQLINGTIVVSGLNE